MFVSFYFYFLFFSPQLSEMTLLMVVAEDPTSTVTDVTPIPNLLQHPQESPPLPSLDPEAAPDPSPAATRASTSLPLQVG